jgi:lipid A 3-O-deacylase
MADVVQVLLRGCLAASALFGGLAADPAAAQAQSGSRATPPIWFGIEEVRLGVLTHIEGASGGETGPSINAEVIFPSWFPKYESTLARWLLSNSRPHIGASINTAGNTSQLYFGKTWTIPLTGPLFFEVSLGGTVHNGRLRSHYDQDPQFVAAYGCALNFRESLSLGVDIGGNLRLLATVDHMSNGAGIAGNVGVVICSGYNRSINNVGGRFSYSFN